jgi:hypothetical protein
MNGLLFGPLSPTLSHEGRGSLKLQTIRLYCDGIPALPLPSWDKGTLEAQQRVGERGREIGC